MKANEAIRFWIEAIVDRNPQLSHSGENVKTYDDKLQYLVDF